jgi:hypothetical protein
MSDTMQRTLARVSSVLAWIILAALLLQFYFAGLGIFGATTFELHRVFGYAMSLPVVVLLVLVAIARLSWRLTGVAATLVILSFAQGVLPPLREDLPWIAALHPVNALILMALTSYIARQSWESAQRRGRVAPERRTEEPVGAGSR